MSQCFLDRTRICDSDCVCWVDEKLQTRERTSACFLLRSVVAANNMIVDGTMRVKHPIGAPPPEIT